MQKEVYDGNSPLHGLEDLDYADDIVLCRSSRVHIHEKITVLEDAARTTGLNIHAEN